MCTAAPTPSPTGPISVNGTCEAEDWCVSSPNDHQNYGTLLSCNITFWMDATFHGVEFETEIGYDTPTVEGVDDSRLDSSVSPCLASLKMSTPLIGSWVRGSAWCTRRQVMLHHEPDGPGPRRVDCCNRRDVQQWQIESRRNALRTASKSKT